jgi:CBS domain containing-hemolysin-like protein
VSSKATASEVQREARRSGHLRIITSDKAGHLNGFVHVRDSLALKPSATVESIVRPLYRVKAATPVYEMLKDMRDGGVQLALVETAFGPQVLTIKDVIQRILP